MTSTIPPTEQIAALIKEAGNIVALTGAGISTPSGIPDFRSPGSGLWKHINPIDVASSIAFRQHPEKFYEWVRPLAKKILTAKPNAAHFALAQLESAGKLNAVITQNIDSLHQAAGSKQVLEVHGHVREFTCVRCYTVQEIDSLLDEFLSDGAIPTCSCGGILKPNVILFGEQLPVQILLDAIHVTEKADLLIIAGSSLEVAPISDLPHDAHQRGAKIVIINEQETYLDKQADVVIHADLARILPQIVELVTGS
jgi:NAD-dependent deacetylase